MGLEAIATREQELSDMMFSALGHTAGISILAPEQKDRLSVFALSLEGTHYNLATRILNDRFGIQIACSGLRCADASRLIGEGDAPVAAAATRKFRGTPVRASTGRRTRTMRGGRCRGRTRPSCKRNNERCTAAARDRTRPPRR